MIFALVPLTEAMGGILAHSANLPDGKLAKGVVLNAAAIARLRAADIDAVTVAMLGPGDCAEDAAAARLGAALASADLPVAPAHSGRANLTARRAGLLRVDTTAVGAINTVDEGVTLATLPNFASVAEGTLVATAKIIPYAVPAAAVSQAETRAQGALSLRPYRRKSYDLILTRTPGFRETLLGKGHEAIAARIAGLNGVLGVVSVVDHETAAVAAGLCGSNADVVLILGASATSDRHDVIPAAIDAAGGQLDRFGMPVDPGNLLCLGRIDGRVVVGLPGCARAPALNGTDWVLQRLAAEIDVTGADIAGMGVGGLLKEIPTRRQPREARARTRDGAAVVVLAAGRSRRMRGAHKLLEQIDGESLLRRAVRRALAAELASVRVVLRPTDAALAAEVADLPVEMIFADEADKGLSASLRAGLRAVDGDVASVIIALADMPDIGPDHLRALADAHDPDVDALIAVPVTPEGKRGNPVLFDARFLPELLRLTGDQGAKSVIASAGDVVVEVPLGDAILTDLDTPEAWTAWRARRQAR